MRRYKQKQADSHTQRWPLVASVTLRMHRYSGLVT